MSVYVVADGSLCLLWGDMLPPVAVLQLMIACDVFFTQNAALGSLRDCT